MRECFERALPELTRRVFRADVDALERELRTVDSEVLLGQPSRFHGALRELDEQARGAIALARRIAEERRILDRRFQVYREGLASAETESERRELLLELLALVTPPERLIADRRALRAPHDRRFLGLDAAAERIARAQERRARKEEFLTRAACDSLSALVKNLLHNARTLESHAGEGVGGATAVRRAAKGALDHLKAIDLESFLLAQLRGSPRGPNRVAALQGAAQLAGELPPEDRALLLSPDGLSLVVRCALDRDEPVWVQRAALTLLAAISPRTASDAIQRRLLPEREVPPEDIFVRGHAAHLALPTLGENAGTALLCAALRHPEPSEHVRMELCRALARAKNIDAERALLERVRGEDHERDASPRVRAVVAILWREKAARGDAHQEIAARTLAWLIRYDPAFIVRRVALEEAVELAEMRQRASRRFKVDRLDHIILESMDEVIRSDPDVRLKRLAAGAREAIVVRTLAAYDWVRSRISGALDALPEGKTLALPARDVTVPEGLLGRVLAHENREAFGLTVERRGARYLVHKGDRFRRRLWRVLHELRSPDSAKRQGHRHTIGRVFRGHIRIHPGTLSELVETKVPGERVHLGSEMAWRRFLPTVDDYLSLFAWRPWRRHRRVTVHASEGLVEIYDGRPWWTALWGQLRMSWAYRRLAQLRNGGPHDKRFPDRSAFLKTMRDRFGLQTRFLPASYSFEGRVYRLEDPTIAEHYQHARDPGVSERTLAFSGDAGAMGADSPLDSAVYEEGFASDTLQGVDDLLQPLMPSDATGAVTLPGAEVSQASLSASTTGNDLDVLEPRFEAADTGLGPDDTHPDLGQVDGSGGPLGPDDTWAQAPAGPEDTAAPPSPDDTLADPADLTSSAPVRKEPVAGAADPPRPRARGVALGASDSVFGVSQADATRDEPAAGRSGEATRDEPRGLSGKSDPLAWSRAGSGSATRDDMDWSKGAPDDATRDDLAWSKGAPDDATRDDLAWSRAGSGMATREEPAPPSQLLPAGPGPLADTAGGPPPTSLADTSNEPPPPDPLADTSNEPPRPEPLADTSNEPPPPDPLADTSPDLDPLLDTSPGAPDPLEDTAAGDDEDGLSETPVESALDPDPFDLIDPEPGPLDETQAAPPPFKRLRTVERQALTGVALESGDAAATDPSEETSAEGGSEALGASASGEEGPADPEEGGVVTLDPSSVVLASGLLEQIAEHLARNRDLFYLYWQTSGSPWHLALVILGFGAAFFARQVGAAREIRRARRAVPLVIGGWGTRGKSGTERKKAALFEALGCEVLTKTTGCEAMVIHSQPGVRSRELFIYRPYDKATIWEQRDMLVLAEQLEAHVFLYECMALNPRYVRIVQDGWMRDDLTTITNAYPDHEDIQGPAGVDLPRVMCEFIPRDTTCFTAEETMLPILREGARDKRTRLEAIRWRDAALIPEDVLARYPYEVHPLNLALVTRMADHLGVERDFCWKEIADYLVPDLGVLKVFPKARHLDRVLEFSNGHSANERHGFNANWKRLGLDTLDPVKQPERWLCTVVNNRGDRVARSKVFADCLAFDVRVHAHFLIGTNLQGLSGYIEKALDTRLEGFRLVPEEADDPVSAARATLKGELADLFLPLEPDQVVARAQAMLAGFLPGGGDDAAALLAQSGVAPAIHASPLRAPELDPFLEGPGPTDPELTRALDLLRQRLGEREAASDTSDAACEWIERWVRASGTVRAAIAYVGDAYAKPLGPDAREALDEQARELLRRGFLRKIIVIPDPTISGDGIVSKIARSCPPGFEVHIHGCQNIKGPGLDWCYRWIHLARVVKAKEQLESPRAHERLAALGELAAHSDYGILDAPVALEAVREAQARPMNQDLAFQTQADLALEHIEAQLAAARERLSASRTTEGAFGRFAARILKSVLDSIERFLDADDSKYRRRMANRVFADLAAGRVGHERAAKELRLVMKRQKGGWLRTALEERLRWVFGGLGVQPARAEKPVATEGDRD